ncbi:MAG: hypothetical protein HY944_08875 [Gemmatimonadetes bacterium]|nr:hypothetical protein [Gemmatimonadota bacterium]
MTAHRLGRTHSRLAARQRRTRRSAVAAWVALVALPCVAPAQTASPRTPSVGSAHTTPPSEARSVRGRVVRGARTSARPVVNTWVVLHRVGTDRAAPLDSTRTDGAGRFAFRYRTSGDPDAVYFASSVYAGIAYFTPPLTARDVSGADAELVVHDTTSGPVPVHTRARHVVFSAPGEEKRRIILEVYELSNDSTVTRVAAGDTGVVWEAVLLDGARNARVGQTDFSGGAVRFEEGRARLAAPFAPGLKQFSFSYEVPVETEHAFIVDGPTDVLEVLLEDALGRAEGAGLTSTGATTSGGRTFARFVAQDVPAGAVVRVSVPGAGAVSGNQVRVLLTMIALGAVLLIGLARTMMARGGRPRRRRPAEGIAELRAALEALDAAFAANANPTADERADHWQARAHLTKQISDAVAREQGLS